MDIYHRLFDELGKSELKYRGAKHIFLMSKDVFDDPKMLLSILEQLEKSVRGSINVLLELDYLYKKVNLTKSIEKNFEIFYKVSGVRYGLVDKDIELIKKLLFFAEIHNNAEIEFAKSGKAVILHESKVHELDYELVENFVNLSEKIIKIAKKALEERLERYK